MPLSRLLDEVDPAEFALWVAADQVLNLLPDSWVQTGTIAAAVYNSSGFARTHVFPSDFIPRSTPPADDEDDLAKFDRLVPGA